MAPLAALANSAQLGLSDTQVSGDVASLAALANLVQLGLLDTQVSGDAEPLAALVNLTTLYLTALFYDTYDAFITPEGKSRDDVSITIVKFGYMLIDRCPRGQRGHFLYTWSWCNVVFPRA